MQSGLQGVGYDSALSLIIDIRTVIPGSGTTAPVGWAALPLFQNGPGRYMASGYYQLPIFKAGHHSAKTACCFGIYDKHCDAVHWKAADCVNLADHTGKRYILWLYCAGRGVHICPHMRNRQMQAL